jgi:hypothetical protein
MFRDARGQGSLTLVGALALAPVLVTASAASASSAAPAPVVVPHTLFHPPGPDESRLAVGLGVAIDFQRYATNGQIPVLPVIDLRLRYRLSKSVFAAAELQTMFVVNTAAAGIGWWTSFSQAPRLSVSFRLLGGTLIGWLVGSGYNTATVSPILEPSVTVGLAMDDGVRWTLREQMVLTRWQFVDNGGYWVENTQSSVWAGMETTLTLENLLDRGGNIYVGLGAIFARSSLSLWIPFAQQTELYFYPRLFCGYVF